jgi:hypothetical protein
VLFTFPSRYWFTIGRQGVFSLTAWSPQIHAKFPVHRVTQEIPRAGWVFGYGPFTPSRAAFHPLRLTAPVPRRAPLNPPGINRGFGLFRVRSPLLTESNSLSVPPVTEMFHFTGFRLAALLKFGPQSPNVTSAGLPHSDIHGSTRVYRSPWLIAACHVLLRLLAPRHP